MPIWFTAILLALATHRVTRLMTRDQIPLVRTPRDAFVRRWGAPSQLPDGSDVPRELRNVSYSGRKTNILMRSLAYLWECDWCASVWVGSALCVLTNFHGSNWWWQTGLLAAAVSSVTGLIAQREPD